MRAYYRPKEWHVYALGSFLGVLSMVLLFGALAYGDDQRTHRVIENPVQDGNMVLRVNDGGVKTDALTITGSTGAAEIGPSGFSGIHTLNGQLNLRGNINSGVNTYTGPTYVYLGVPSPTMADDSVIQLSPNSAVGVLIIGARNSISTGCVGIVSYRIDASNFMQIISAGSLLDTSTGVLTGTTGTDGRCRVSSGADGKIYFENRVGASRVFSFTFLGI